MLLQRALLSTGDKAVTKTRQKSVASRYVDSAVNGREGRQLAVFGSGEMRSFSSNSFPFPVKGWAGMACGKSPGGERRVCDSH